MSVIVMGYVKVSEKDAFLARLELKNFSRIPSNLPGKIYMVRGSEKIILNDEITSLWGSQNAQFDYKQAPELLKML